jgi:hypothetical protein
MAAPFKVYLLEGKTLVDWVKANNDSHSDAENKPLSLQNSSFDKNDFSALGKKSEINLNDDILQIHLPMYRHKLLGLLFVGITLISIYGFYDNFQDMPDFKNAVRSLFWVSLFVAHTLEVLLFLLLSIIFFFHQVYIDISANEIHSREYILSFKFYSKLLKRDDIDYLRVIIGSETRTHKKTTKTFQIKAYPKLKQADGSMKIKYIITILAGIKNYELSVQFMQYIKNKLNLEYSDNF